MGSILGDFDKVDYIIDQILVEIRVYVVEHSEGDFIVGSVGGQVHFKFPDFLWLVFCGLEGIYEVWCGPMMDGMGASPGENILQNLFSERIHN